MIQLVEDSRILLWDIDGTLVRSARVGLFKDYTVPVLEEVYGTAGRLREMTVSGMTDLQIVSEALRDEGFTSQQIRERMRDLRASYMRAMKRATGNGERLFETLPGAQETLTATDEHTRYRNALLTGNIRPAARLKIRLVNLSQFFKLPGAFGDDSEDRRDLPALAARRINRRLKLDLRPSQFIVIGDTPNDIACAKHFGARAVAVATGRSYGLDQLLQHEPDAVLPNLSDAELVIRTLDKL
ncbi:MAG: phosphoglycolate phosphatase [Blastocatellia bacterium]|jgi:phosphoglycolate phosphatase-like HAD superfamily hydrolase|nr:phosphoglycolate phosphatase [Blastocatellia bacterium]